MSWTNEKVCISSIIPILFIKKYYNHNIFTTLLNQIIGGKLLLFLIWIYNFNYLFTQS